MTSKGGLRITKQEDLALILGPRRLCKSMVREGIRGSMRNLVGKGDGRNPVLPISLRKWKSVSLNQNKVLSSCTGMSFLSHMDMAWLLQSTDPH